MSRYLTILSTMIVLMCLHSKDLHAHRSLPDTVIKHSTDAVLDDWDPSAFDIHEASGIRMAADNDTEKLYIALYITNKDVQKRVMLGGMQLFIDTKAKKKEGTFIEFPVQKTPQELAQYFSVKTAEQSSSDVQTFREQMAGSMLFLKKTGFKGQQYDTELQPINTPNEIMVSFGWDDRSIMYIEYEIPFNKLGEKVSLVNKPLSVGIKLNAVNSPTPSEQPMRTSTKVIAMPLSAGPPSSANFGTSTTGFRTNQPINKSTFPEQSFWLKHQIY
jgi:hypothetical protein